MSVGTAKLRTRSGRLLHPIGIGTWGYGEYSVFSPGAQAEIEAIQYAISLGQNHIDTAEMYANGGAERVVGRAIEPTDRYDLFIASKLWKNHVAPASVRPAVEAILKRLGTDYLDMLYIHAPWFDSPWRDAIPQINQLIDEGIVRYFGVSNFNAVHLQEALKITTHPIVADQLHYSFTRQQEVTSELRDICSANNISIVAYMPLEKGEVVNGPLVKQMARKYNATPAQVALAWLLARDALPIPKALQKTHIDQNAKLQNIRLLQEGILRNSVD